MAVAEGRKFLQIVRIRTVARRLQLTQDIPRVLPSPGLGNQAKLPASDCSFRRPGRSSRRWDAQFNARFESAHDEAVEGRERAFHARSDAIEGLVGAAVPFVHQPR